MTSRSLIKDDQLRPQKELVSVVVNRFWCWGIRIRLDDWYGTQISINTIFFLFEIMSHHTVTANVTAASCREFLNRVYSARETIIIYILMSCSFSSGDSDMQLCLSLLVLLRRMILVST